MGNTPLVSVVMSVYNGARYLRQAVDSILNQSYSNFEFIIIEDGSTDDSMAIINTYQDSRIRLIDNVVNLGLPTSLNRGIREAKGKYIARQDADDVSLHHRLQRQVEWLDSQENIGATGTWALEIDMNGRIFNKQKFIGDPESQLQQLLRDGLNPWPHGSAMMRKDLVIDVGGYDERFWYTQDFDLWLRLWSHCEFKVFPEYLYKLRRVPVETTFKKLCQSEYFYWAVRQFNEKERIDFPDVRECVRNKFPEATTKHTLHLAKYWASLALFALKNRRWAPSILYLLTMLKALFFWLVSRALLNRVRARN